MPVNFGSLSVANAFVGDKAVSAMYLGGTQVYPNEVAWEEGTGDISLRIQTPDDATSLTFAFFNSVDVESDGYVSVDWGDGKRNTYKASTSVSPTHTYAEAGEYVVKMTGSKFTEIHGAGAGLTYTDWVRKILSLKMPEDSTGVSLNHAFAYCTELTGNIPAWDEKITIAYATYCDCTGLTGSIPAWGENITRANHTYRGCTGLTGSIPEWGANITEAGYTYRDCTGLTGSVPAWGENIEAIDCAYRGCTGLTGSVPEWGAKVASAYGTYFRCTGLTGSIPAWGAKILSADSTYYYCTGLESCSDALLENPMPFLIMSHSDCVTGCVDAIRQHFTEGWGGTKAA